MKKTFKILLSFLLVFVLVGVVKAQESLGIESISIRLEREVKYPGDYSYVRYEIEGEAEDKSAVVTVSGNNSEHTKIINTNYGYYFQVGTNETSTAITVTATSNADPTKSDSVVVNLLEPAVINEINFTYNDENVPYMSTITTNAFLDWIMHSYSTNTANLEVENNGNVTLYYVSDGKVHYINPSDEGLGTEKEYAVLLSAHTTDLAYTFPQSVKDLTYSANAPVSTIDGITIKVNGVVRNDVFVSYSESWKDIMVHVPFGQAPLSHHVEFDTNGGSEIQPQEVIHNGYINTTDTPTKPGYVFEGWYFDEELTDYVYSSSPITEDTTLYAKWDTLIPEVNATIAIPVPGNTPGEISLIGTNLKYIVGSDYWYLYESPYPHIESTDTFEEGKPYAYRVYFEPMDGYAFSSDTKFYIKGVNTSCYGGPGNREITFYLHDIAFNTNGGSEIESQRLYSSDKVVMPANPTKEGVIFGGWYTDSELTEKFDFNTPINKSYVLYAKWVTSANVPVVKLSANNNMVTLRWDEDPAAVKYVVYRSNDNKKWTNYKTVTTNSFVDKSLTYNKAYYYKVRACDVNKCTGYSNTVGKKIVPNKVNLTIKSASTTNIRLHWDKVSTNGYEIYRSTNKKTWSKIATITKNTTLDYNNTKLKANYGYYYKVRAYKVAGGKKVYGPWSDMVATKTAPLTPALKLAIRDFEQINIIIGSTKGANQYQIYRSFDGKNYELLHNLPAPGTMADGPHAFGTPIYIKLRACNAWGRCSAFASAGIRQSAQTPSFAIASPRTKVITTKINPVEKADGYEVFRSTSKNGKYTLVKSLTKDNSLTFNNSAKKGYTYFYKVRSYVLVDGKKIYSPLSGYRYVKSK